MKAAQFDEYGAPEVIKVRDVSKPVVGPGQVMVEVHASSVNPFDDKLRLGYMKEFIPLELPITVGADIAGIISEVGDGVTDIKVGQKVWGQANKVAGATGAMAEFAVTARGQVGEIPANLDFAEAASLPLVAVSALQGLVDEARLQAGQKILIQGGSGGIGSVAIQIAKHLGAFVAATASGAGLDYATKLGADKVIDYKSEKFWDVIKDYDVVFDTVGGDTAKDSFQVLKKGGVLVSMTGQPDEATAAKYGVLAKGVRATVTTEVLDALRALVEDGVVTPHVAKTFPLDEAARAFAEFEHGGVLGKIVIVVK